MRPRYAYSEYDDLWQSDPRRYGAISLQKAIASLQMDTKAVSMLMNRGVLECFELGDESNVTLMITLQSLLLFKSAKTAAAQDRPHEALGPDAQQPHSGLPPRGRSASDPALQALGAAGLARPESHLSSSAARGPGDRGRDIEKELKDDELAHGQYSASQAEFA